MHREGRKAIALVEIGEARLIRPGFNVFCRTQTNFHLNPPGFHPNLEQLRADFHSQTQ